MILYQPFQNYVYTTHAHGYNEIVAIILLRIIPNNVTDVNEKLNLHVLSFIQIASSLVRWPAW